MFYNIAIFILKYYATMLEGSNLNGLYNNLFIVYILCLFLQIEDDAHNCCMCRLCLKRNNFIRDFFTLIIVNYECHVPILLCESPEDIY